MKTIKTNNGISATRTYEAPEAEVIKVSSNAPLMLSGGGTIPPTEEEEG